VELIVGRELTGARAIAELPLRTVDVGGFTMPISRMIPMSATTLSSVRNSSSARRAPTPADGKVERIVIGWM
jgi:hypothetical protein